MKSFPLVKGFRHVLDEEEDDWLIRLTGLFQWLGGGVGGAGRQWRGVSVARGVSGAGRQWRGASEVRGILTALEPVSTS